MQKEKMKEEKLILRISIIASAIVVISETIMAILSHSNTILMSSIFGVADLAIIMISMFIIPLVYKPITEKKPYGYSQVESLFIILKGCILTYVILSLIIDNVKILLAGGTQLDYSSLVIFQGVRIIYDFIVYKGLSKLNKKVDTPISDAELLAWKIDIFSAIGVFIAFLLQIVIKNTKLSIISPYMDSLVAIIIALCMLPKPIKLVIESFKNLALFAPDEKTVDEIKTIVDKQLKPWPYTVSFYDIVRTGRKIWVEVYFKTNNNIVNLKELKNARKNLENELKNNFDEIYVELTPEV